MHAMRNTLTATPRPCVGTATALAACLLLTGCGQRGPLYIPDTPAAAQRATLPQAVFGGGAPGTRATASPRNPDGDEVEAAPLDNDSGSDP